MQLQPTYHGQSHLIGSSSPSPSTASYSAALPKNYSDEDPRHPSTSTSETHETQGTMTNSRSRSQSRSASTSTSSYSGMEKQKRLLNQFPVNKRKVRFQESDDTSNEKEYIPRKTKQQLDQRDQKAQSYTHTRTHTQRSASTSTSTADGKTRSGPRETKSNRPIPLPSQQEEFPEQDDFISQIFSSKSNIGMKALLGAAAGALYGAFQNLSSRRMLSYKLYPEPERFDLDQQMSRLFHRLSSYRTYHEEAYCRALENTDRLFMHEASIWRTGARFGDVSLSKMWLMNVATDLLNFRMQVSVPKDRARFNIITRAILDRLILHHQNIIRRCRALRPRHEFIKKKMERDPYHYACADFTPSQDESKPNECHSCGMLRQYHRVRPSSAADGIPTSASSSEPPGQEPSRRPVSATNQNPTGRSANDKNEHDGGEVPAVAYVDVR